MMEVEKRCVCEGPGFWIRLESIESKMRADKLENSRGLKGLEVSVRLRFSCRRKRVQRRWEARCCGPELGVSIVE